MTLSNVHIDREFELTIGDEKQIVRVKMDLEKIASVMGWKAVKSISGKCVDGFVTVTHVRKTPERQV